MRKLNIGIDFGGVIADEGKYRVKAAKKMYDIDVPLSECMKHKIISKDYLSYEQYQALKKWIYESEETYCFLLQPIAGAIKCLKVLSELGHSCKILTNRHGKTFKFTKKWIQNHSINIDLLSSNGGSKNAIARQENFDVFIDDDIEKLLELVGIVPHLYLMSWPYNQDQQLLDEVKPVSSWKKFYEEITLLSTSKGHS
jgi:uncharacterized HAD superfamily protein